MCESQSVFFIYTEGECSSIEKIKASLELDAEKILTEENFTLKVIENVSLGKIVNLDLNNY
ncbi:hypothetical protein KJ863_02660 [Patescibacteria group bacterium]|nr:hypothetical protein [Candidatus Falkowbacteria bacterium]MBU3905454.1 hypothetical protein [Patescibacteria group bacterium]MBU4072998.1 hypothetical protein [Patescibacteria group bacterium]MBU4103011.1 hypothetical protein [Patescibacteria group bacterium]